MTVIFSNMLDDDCRILQEIWRGLDNVNVIEIRPDSVDWEDMVDAAIAAETDTLILAGHGTTRGLLFPDFSRGEYIVHQFNVHLIRAERVVCSWCYASTFVRDNHLHAFATSMFISNVNEAYDNVIMDYDQEQINANSLRFQQEMNYLLRENIPMDEWVMQLGSHMDIENAIDVFNRQALYYD